MLQRGAASDWTEDRAYRITLQLTGDELAAIHARNEVAFARTPLQ